MYLKVKGKVYRGLGREECSILQRREVKTEKSGKFAQCPTVGGVGT